MRRQNVASTSVRRYFDGHEPTGELTLNMEKALRSSLFTVFIVFFQDYLCEYLECLTVRYLLQLFIISSSSQLGGCQTFLVGQASFVISGVMEQPLTYGRKPIVGAKMKQGRKHEVSILFTGRLFCKRKAFIGCQ